MIYKGKHDSSLSTSKDWCITNWISKVALPFLLVVSFFEAGAQSFGGQQIIDYVNNAPNKVMSFDMDKDGRNDVIATSLWSTKLVWYKNDGQGGFTKNLISNNIPKVNDIDTTDFTQNGKTDLIVATNNGLEWYKNDGQQNFSAQLIDSVPDARQVHAADMDKDTDVDVVVALNNDGLYWYENNGQQSFTKHTIDSTITGIQDLLVRDLNINTHKDVIVASYTTDQLTWYENNGQQSFQKKVISNNAKGARGIEVTDFDKDGYKDIFCAEFKDNRVAWYKNDGQQNFTVNNLPGPIKGAHDIRATDLTGNGYDDLVVAAFNSNQVVWIANDSAKQFVMDTITSKTRGVRSIDAADLNGNGKQDVLAAAYDGYHISWYENLITPADTTNPTTSPSDSAQKGTALEFDGVDDYVEVPVSNNTNIMDSGTLSLWVTTSTHNSPDPDRIAFSHFSQNKDRLYIGMDAPSGEWQIGLGATFVTTGKIIKKNQWHLAKLVWKDGDYKFYVNGKKVKSGSYNGQVSIGNNNWEIGRFGGDEDRYWKGMIREVHLYNQPIYNNGLGVYFCKSLDAKEYPVQLINYWPLNEGKGTIVSDVIDQKSGFFKPNAKNGPQWKTNITPICDNDTAKDQFACANQALNVIDYLQGFTLKGDIISPKRSKPDNAVNSDDGDFFSLGFHKKSFITLGFDSLMTGQLNIYETTWNSVNYVEKAHVYVSEDQTNWHYVGEANNQNNRKGDIHPYSFYLDSIRYKYVKVVNATDSTQFRNGADGFDVNAVCAEKIASVQAPNPEPACQYYGDQIMSHRQGTHKNGLFINFTRSNPQNALGQPSLPLYSLGFQNTMNQKPYVVLGFSDLMTGKLSIYEYNNNPLEKARVYVSEDTTNWTYVGLAHNFNHAFGDQYATTFDLDSIDYQYVKLVNATDKAIWGPIADGFDLTAICAEKKASYNTIQTETTGCLTVKYLDSNQNHQSNTLTRRYRVINKCNQDWSHTAFALKPSVQAVSYSSKGNYPVENTTANPFHSIKFKCNKSDCFKNGDSSWFQYTVPIKDTLGMIQIAVKTGQNQGNVGFSVGGKGDQDHSAGLSRSKTNRGKIYPNPVKVGEDLVVDFEKPVVQNQTLELINTNGQAVYSKNTLETSDKVRLSTSSMKPGLYFVKINGKPLKKVIIH